MTSSVAADTIPSWELDRSDDDDDDDDVAVANTDSLADLPLTSQDGGKVGPLPVAAARRSPDRDGRGPAADPGRGRRAAVTQYLGQNHPAISVVEEERTTDDDPEDDDVLGGGSTGTTTAAVDGRAAHYVVDLPQGPRMRYPRTSLLGKPLGFRASRRDTRLKRLQNRCYIFLERPKTCLAITYHTAV